MTLAKGARNDQFFPGWGVGIDPFYTGFPSNSTYNVELEMGSSNGDRLSGVRRVPSSADREATIIEENRLTQFPLRLGTFLFVVAILALFYIVVIQQVQIGHQQVQIGQLRQISTDSDRAFNFSDALNELPARSQDNLLCLHSGVTGILRARHGREKSGTENNAVEIKTGLARQHNAIAIAKETELIGLLVDVDLSGGRSRL